MSCGAVIGSSCHRCFEHVIRSLGIYKGWDAGVQPFGKIHRDDALEVLEHSWPHRILVGVGVGQLGAPAVPEHDDLTETVSRKASHRPADCDCNFHIAQVEGGVPVLHEAEVGGAGRYQGIPEVHAPDIDIVLGQGNGQGLPAKLCVGVKGQIEHAGVAVNHHHRIAGDGRDSRRCFLDHPVQAELVIRAWANLYYRRVLVDIASDLLAGNRAQGTADPGRGCSMAEDGGVSWRRLAP